ncbi:MAG: ABC transporter ATP-binding protein [Planctomycetota bacterium]
MLDYQQEDEILGKAYDSRLMKRLLRYAFPYKWRVFLAMSLSFILTGLFIVGPLMIAAAFDKGIACSDKPFLIMIMLAYLDLQVLQLSFNYINSYLLTSLGQRIMLDLRMEVFTHLQKMSLNFFDKNPVGRLVTRVTSDIVALSDLLSMGIVSVVNDIFLLGGLVVVMFMLNPFLAMVLISSFPLAVIIMLVFKPRLRTSYRLIRQRLARLNAYIAESVSGIRIIQIFNQEERIINKFKSLNQEHYDANYKAIVYFSIFLPSISALSGIAIGLVFYYGGGTVIRGAIQLGILIAFIDYSIHFFSPIQDLTDKYNIFQGAMASAERIFRILDTEEDIKDPVLPKPIVTSRGEVTFDDVWFSYNNETDVLKGISFNIKSGESVALVGVSGGGKTTVINLLNRFYDIKKGRILIDGIDIKSVRQSDLRRQLGIVLQDVFLFSGNILENIRLNDTSISLEKVREIAHYVNADTFIEKLPNKYLTRVEERGATLSTGQRQLLSFARAMVFDPKILILDEATSAVDVETEYYIQEAIKKLIKSMTSIIIAHRLSTIQNVDRIIVMHKGEIREVGSHQELMAQKGIYHKLYQMQYL